MQANACHPLHPNPSPRELVVKAPADVPAPVKACLARLSELALGPIDVRVLFRIEQYAKLAREVWRVDQDDGIGLPMAVDPCTGMPMAMPIAVGGYSNMMTSGMQMGGAMAPSSAAETFGATAIREITAAMTKKSPEEIVRAISAAKGLGLDDLAAQLEESLGCTPTKPRPVTVLAPSKKQMKSRRRLRAKKKAA